MKRAVLSAVALAGATLVLTTAPAFADDGKTPTATPAALGNYQQVSAVVSTAPNSQTSGTATCPKASKAVGGGAVISGVSLNDNLNASRPTPDGRGWQVYVNNGDSSAGQFIVYAVCAKGVAKYQIVQGSAIVDPPGSTSSTQPSATCPTGTVVLGGGGFTTSASNLVELAGASSTSKGRTFFAAYNNRSSGTTNDSAYAVCGKKPTGYAVVNGAGADVPSGTQGNATATCPANTVVLSGGGGPVLFREAKIDLNSSAPVNNTSWRTWINNGSSTVSTLLPQVICAALG